MIRQELHRVRAELPVRPAGALPWVVAVPLFASLVFGLMGVAWAVGAGASLERDRQVAAQAAALAGQFAECAGRYTPSCGHIVPAVLVNQPTPDQLYDHLARRVEGRQGLPDWPAPGIASAQALHRLDPELSQRLRDSALERDWRADRTHLPMRMHTAQLHEAVPDDPELVPAWDAAGQHEQDLIRAWELAAEVANDGQNPGWRQAAQASLLGHLGATPWLFGSAFAFLLMSLAVNGLGRRLQRPVRVEVGPHGIRLDGQSIRARAIADVRLVEGCIVIDLWDGRTVASRPLVDDLDIYAVIAAMDRVRSAPTEHIQDDAAEQQVRAAAQQLRDRS